MHNLASVSSNAIEKQVPLCIMEKNHSARTIHHVWYHQDHRLQLRLLYQEH